MLNQSQQNLLHQFKQLIKQIEQAIKNPQPLRKKNPEVWETPEAWTIVVKELKQIYQNYQNKPSELGEILISLAKYFDYYSFDWVTKEHIKKINDIVSKIINLSIQTIGTLPPTQAQQCNQHEDQACVIDQLGPRCLHRINNNSPKLSLPRKYACTFMPTPKIMPIESLITIYRVIGPTNNPDGLYWIESLPKTITDWRSQSAVLSLWNKDQYYVTLELPIGKCMWKGCAASQKVPNVDTNCILPGGGEQLWIPPIIMQSLKGQISQRIKTNW